MPSLTGHGFHPGDDGPDLPFAYVSGRSHFTVSYYGANVYPENIGSGNHSFEIGDWREDRQDCMAGASL
ncbi:hypothetical protein AB0G15_22795 [Streptosporangium sp. NPDC023825]|uniref:hypothetical protein n=1 Tax=Streptosporangium sp. NPDC023825 TaxID=3154909 RepID=UPI003438F743